MSQHGGAVFVMDVPVSWMTSYLLRHSFMTGQLSLSLMAQHVFVCVCVCVALRPGSVLGPVRGHPVRVNTKDRLNILYIKSVQFKQATSPG